MDLYRILSNNYIFRGLPRRVLAGLASLTEVREFRGGDTIMREFGRDSDLYIILEGRGTIRSYTGEPIAEVGPGSVVGEMALIDEKPRSATVVSVGPSKAAILPSGILRGMMQADPECGAVVASNIARVLSSRLRSSNSLSHAPTPSELGARA